MRILLIEDDTALGPMLVKLIERWKMDVTLAPDGDAAAALMEARPADLIVADLCLPGANGVDVVTRLRETERFRSVPVLMISGKAERDAIVAASSAGIDGFLAKPFEPEQLRRRILEVYRRFRQARWKVEAKQVWRSRTQAQRAKFAGPIVVFGEAVDSEVDLADPERRPVTEYLGLGRAVIAELNRLQPELRAGYVIAKSTSDVILSLKRPGLRDWVRTVLVSTSCRGNPTLMARLFAINRGRRTPPLYLVYDEAQEISEVHRKGLRDLGVRTLRRSLIDRERMAQILSRFLQVSPAEAEAAEPELAPQQIRSRIVDDIETMAALPPLPQVYERISALARDPASDLREWIGVLRVDPMTCATILRHANSVGHGFKTEIAEIDRAVILLGKNAIVGLVASQAVRTALQAIQDKGFRLDDFWLHSIATGFAAHILAYPLDGGVEGLGPIETLGLRPETLEALRAANLSGRLRLDPAKVNALAAGSLHDIGKGVMVHAYPGLFPLIREELERRDWRAGMLAAEREVAGGLTHTVAGDILVRKWGLADQIGHAAASHHVADIDDGLAFVVGIADVIAQVLYPFPRDGAWPLARALEDGDWEGARPFLPEGFLDQPLLGAAGLANLVRTVGPKVRQFAEEVRRSI